MCGILTLNAGSSSLKFGLYRRGAEPEILLHGMVGGIGRTAQLTLSTDGRKAVTPVDAPTQPDALAVVMQALDPHLEDLEVSGVGHRIVHGGPLYSEPVELAPPVLRALAELVPLAPLHQPHNLAGIETARAAFPAAVQIGCFDTAFHRDHPWVNDTFALPQRFYDEGVRRYGFHGLSYDYITGVLADSYPDLHAGRTVITHLGNGASACAVRGGKSVGSTMGFSALDGLPMGTRCGQIDPGVVLYLIEQEGMSAHDVTKLLYEQSGLLGLSNISGDMQTLLASDLTDAVRAIDYYVLRVRREIGALAAVLSGIDALVFCGGIGENEAPIRQRIVEGLGHLGIEVDAEANQTNATEIGTGPTRVMVIPTDEDRVIARAVNKAIGVEQAETRHHSLAGHH